MINRYIMTLLVLAFATTGAFAQGGLDSGLNKMYKKYKTSADKRAAEKEMEKILEESVNQAYAKLMAWIAINKKAEEQLLKSYQPGYAHKPGEMNLLPLWDDIPAPVPTLPEAKQVNFDSRYNSYISRVEVQQKQLADMLQQHISNDRNTEAQLKADAMKMANQNAVVQQMGGAEAVMNMSEAERKAAGAKLRKDMMSNPGAYTGVSDPGMNAMMQKMMNDPAYREKFNKMTESQKQAEIQKFMSPQPVQQNNAAMEASMKQKNDANKAIDLQLLLGRTLNKMQEATKPYAEGTELANEFYNGLYDKLRDWYKKQYDALPIVAMGEMREKEGLDVLDKCSAIMIYLVQKKEAATRAVLWSSLKNRTKLAIGEFNDFIGAYKWGANADASLLDVSNTEPQVASAVGNIYSDMIRLTKDAAGLTKNHKGWQEQYELMTK